MRCLFIYFYIQYVLSAWYFTYSAYTNFACRLQDLGFIFIEANLVIYLTTNLHEGTVSASTNVTNWIGMMWIMPILGAYIADTHWGCYWTFVVFSVVYIVVNNLPSILFFVVFIDIAVILIIAWKRCILQPTIREICNFFYESMLVKYLYFQISRDH